MKAGMRLTTSDALLVAAFYLMLATGGALWWWRIIRIGPESPSVDLAAAIPAGISVAAAFSSLFYLRKLYKDLFASLAPEFDSSRTSRPATLIYYVSRPIFAAFAAAFVVVIMYAFIRAMSVGHAGANHDFLLFVTASSALLAAVTGTTVIRIETIAGHTFLRPPV